MGSEGTSTSGPRTPWWVWLSVGLVTLGAIIATALVNQPPTVGAGTVAERFLPPDGSAWVLTIDDEDYLVESAWDTGVRFALQAPGAAGESMIGEIEDQGGSLLTAQFWRRTITPLEGDVPQIVQFYLLSDAGIAQLASIGGVQGFAFRPALSVLPARPVAGLSWTQDGAALPFDILDYSTSTTITQLVDGCLHLEDSLSYLDPETSEELYTGATTSSICLGVGPTVSSGVEGGAATSQSLTAFSGRSLDALVDSPEPTWGPTDEWVAAPLTLQVDDATFGTWPALDIPNADVDFTASGIAVLGYGPDAIGYRVDGTTATRAWIAHPGGTIVSSAAIGNALVLGTTKRQLVAYDDSGRRAWSASFPDAVRADPIADGAGGVIAVALDGTVARLDLATGTETWRTTLGVGSVVTPALGDGVVYLVDRDDTVTALDAASGEERWTTTLLAPSTFLITDGDAVLVGVGNGTVLRLAAADGAEEGRVIVPGVPRRAVLADDGLVVQSDAGTTGYAADGAQLFHLPGVGSGLVADGQRIVALGQDGAALLLDASGTELGRFAASLESVGVTYALAAGPTGAWLVGTDNTIITIGAP